MATHTYIDDAPRSTGSVEGELEWRIVAEFHELPGMCLTIEQAMRLWDLDRPTCQATLAALIRCGYIIHDASGRFGLRTAA